MTFDIVGLPSDNITTVSWEPQPQQRGTFAILSTCFVTLGLCSWRVVHLNVPEYCPNVNKSLQAWFFRRWRKFFRFALCFNKKRRPTDSTSQPKVQPPDNLSRLHKFHRWVSSTWHQAVHLLGGHMVVRQFDWMIIGVFAPELIAFAAFQQYWDARTLFKHIENRGFLERKKQPKNAKDDQESQQSGTGKRRHKWTMTHCFYTVMGGFAFKLKDKEYGLIPDIRSREYITLTPSGLLFLAEYEPDIIPDISQDEIKDKSKASSFVKIITLFQAIWFSAQCIVRMAQHLSISLLELNTFAHCVCALLIGLFWMKKPLGVQQPTKLKRLQRIQRMRQRKPSFPKMFVKELGMTVSYDTESSGKKGIGQKHVVALLSMTSAFNGKNAEYHVPADDQGSFSLRHRHSWLPEYINPWKQTNDRVDLLQALPVGFADDDSGRRAKLANRARERYFPQHAQVSDIPLGALQRNSLAYRAYNFPRLDGVRSALPTYLAISFMGLVYGGLHLLAWNAPFQTEAQQVLWCTAGLTITSTGLFVAVALFDNWLWDVVRRSAHPAKAGNDDSCSGSLGRAWAQLCLAVYERVNPVISACKRPFLVVISTIYIVLRVYIFVESLINIAHLPESAFEVVKWSQYVPHIG